MLRTRRSLLPLVVPLARPNRPRWATTTIYDDRAENQSAIARLWVSGHNSGDVGGCLNLVDEHEALRVQIVLTIELDICCLKISGPALLDGMASLFARNSPACNEFGEALHRRWPSSFPPALIKIQQARCACAPPLGLNNLASRAPLRLSADWHRRRNAKPVRRRTATDPTVHRSWNPRKQIA